MEWWLVDGWFLRVLRFYSHFLPKVEKKKKVRKLETNKQKQNPAQPKVTLFN